MVAPEVASEILTDCAEV